jgi:PBP1b-binding outer membrane lipoprotein LpoB
MGLKTKIWILISIVLTVSLWKGCNWVVNTTIDVYNQNTQLVVGYQQQTRNQISTFDADYLSFVEQSKIANISKDVFVEVTQIIMSNRKDGPTVSWKWVQENTYIPYEQFTTFYASLSSFVAEQYSKYSAIENSKQDIVAKQQLLLRTFPNNVINWYLKLPDIKYSFGYISPESTQKFKPKTE